MNKESGYQVLDTEDEISDLNNEETDGCKTADFDAEAGESGYAYDKDAGQESKSSLWKAVVNLVSDIEGTGLLALPYVILKGGVFALIALVVTPFISCYTGRILIECLYEKDEKGRKVRVRANYRHLANACWPTFGGAIALVIQLVDLTLLASLYLVLVASLVHSILIDVPVSERMWMFIAAILGLPSLFLKNLSHIAWLSLVSVVALVIAAVTVIAYGISQYASWDIRSIPLGDFDGVPIALVIIIFSYICHPVLPGVEASLADRSQFNKMLCVSYFFVSLTKITFSLCAYLAFSDNIQDVIVNSLPQGAIHILVSSFLAFNVMLSYPFRTVTIIQTIEDSILPDRQWSKMGNLAWFIFIRIFVNFVTLIPAVSLPYFGLLMAFVGSIAGACVSFIMPCLFHLKLKHSELKLHTIAIDWFIIVFGTCAGALGLVYNGKELLKLYGKASQN